MNKMQLVLKRTLFYPTFLMLSSGMFLMDVRGMGALAAAAAIALAVHVGVNGYDVWKQKQS